MVRCCWSQKHDAPSIAAGNRVADVRDLYRQTFVSKTATSPPIAWPRPRRSPVGEFLKFARVLRSVGCAEGAPARMCPGIARDSGPRAADRQEGHYRRSQNRPRPVDLVKIWASQRSQSMLCPSPPSPATAEYAHSSRRSLPRDFGCF